MPFARTSFPYNQLKAVYGLEQHCQVRTVPYAPPQVRTRAGSEISFPRLSSFPTNNYAQASFEDGCRSPSFPHIGFMQDIREYACVDHRLIHGGIPWTIRVVPHAQQPV